MTKNGIPQWLSVPQRYEPRRDADRFLDRTILSLSSLLARTASSRGNQRDVLCVSPWLLIVSMVLVVLLVALSRGFSFPAIVLVAELVSLSLLDAENILRTLKASFGAVLFSSFVLLPSAFFMGPVPLAIIAIKACASVSAVSLVTGISRWDTLARGLRILPVPGLFLLVMDISVRYISLLGELSLEMFTALKLRSVGRNGGKTSSVASVAGSVFVSSQSMAQELAAAMACRGFTGEYSLPRRIRLSMADIMFLAADAALVVFFFLYGGFL